MEKAQARDLEIYSVWARINRQVEGPLHRLSTIYTAFFAGILVLWTIQPELLNPFQVYLGMGFIFFILAAYIAFTGFLMGNIR